MADIFQSAVPQMGSAFSVEETMLKFSGSAVKDPTLGGLVQGMTVSYTRAIQRIFDLSGAMRKTAFYVVGRAEGSLGIQRFAAPAPLTSSFLVQFGDICEVDNNHIEVAITPGYVDRPSCRNASTDASFRFSFALMNSLNMSVATQAIALTEGVGMMFASLEKTGV
jgi:hypothetical protein